MTKNIVFCLLFAIFIKETVVYAEFICPKVEVVSNDLKEGSEDPDAEEVPAHFKSLYADPDSCWKFYQCDPNNVAHEYYCNQGTEWNDKEKTCVWPKDSTCTDAIRAKQPSHLDHIKAEQEKFKKLKSGNKKGSTPDSSSDKPSSTPDKPSGEEDKPSSSSIKPSVDEDKPSSSTGKPSSTSD